MYDHDFISAGKVADTDEDFNFDRLMSFMIDNGMSGLQYYTRKSLTLFLDEVDSETESKHKVVTIVLIVDQVVIVLLLILLIPFILKVQSSLLKIYHHLCQFKSKDISEWVETCNESASCIKASIAQIYRMHSQVSFEIKPLNAGKEEAEKMPIVFVQKEKKPGNCGSDPVEEEATDKSENTEEGDQLLINKDEALSERKQRIFSKMTRSKTAAYLIYLGFVLLYIAIFRITDGVVFGSIYNDTDLTEYICHLFPRRSYYSLLSLLFLREELKRDRVLSDFDCSLHLHS
eukprot:TRINITY_DN1527_c0_g1_i6.p1 TRINITY_DN1527_c0_g1~~TRINITY_DN1527_c0_g1_i6.p1  ORF type:complete len:289 (-),score=78.12 TRINITY_DN1527_c0_g1_i6:221-1087(-)